MTTARELIQDALGELLEEASEAPIQPDDFQKAVRIMNRMVASWGLPLGYTDIDDPGETITVIPGAILAIQQNLALNLVSTFDGFASPDLKREARISYRNMLSQIINIQPLKLPSTLAKGTGNNRGNFGNNNTFYPPQGAELIQEGEGSILLEN